MWSTERDPKGSGQRGTSQIFFPNGYTNTFYTTHIQELIARARGKRSTQRQLRVLARAVVGRRWSVEIVEAAIATGAIVRVGRDSWEVAR